MSDQELAKKFWEEVSLRYFLDAYANSTGKRLSHMCPSERPDFIGQRPDGSIVGLEMTKLMRDSAFARWTTHPEEYLDPHSAISCLRAIIGSKEEKRCQPEWSHPDSAILVIELMDCPLEEMRPFLDSEEFDSHGFAELWLADFTDIEAYSSVSLFCLYPRRWRGFHNRWNAGHKPYG